MKNYYEHFLSQTRKEGTDKTDVSPSVSFVSSVQAYKKQTMSVNVDGEPNFKTCPVNRAIHNCDH